MSKLKNEEYYLRQLIANHDKYEDDILRDTGWDRLADEYESTQKWYA